MPLFARSQRATTTTTPRRGGKLNPFSSGNGRSRKENRVAGLKVHFDDSPIVELRTR